MPDGIQAAILNNVPKNTMKAIDEIWSYLSKSSEISVDVKSELPACARLNETSDE